MKKLSTKMGMFVSLVATVFLLAACTQTGGESAPPDSSDGYTAQELTFPVSDAEKDKYNKAIFEIDPFSICFELPNGWTTGDYDPQAETYLYNGVWSRVGIYDENGQCLGAIGYNTFEPDEGADGEPMAIYNQIALENDYQFNVKNTYTVVANSSTGETATVDIYYSPVFDGASGVEKINRGILAYDSEKLIYVAFEFDSTSVSDEVVTDIAGSIEF